MAICNYCKRDMEKAESCIPVKVMIDGKQYEQIKYGDESRSDFHAEKINCCHDCGINKGGYHHPGCDVEECPKCHGQLIGCECLNPDDPRS